MIYNTCSISPAATEKPFELPAGVEVGKDGKLVDNRAFYQTWITGNSSLETLQKQYDKHASKFTLATPFEFIGKIFTNIFTFIVDIFKSIFNPCCGDEAENTTKKTDK